jgi:hypothetical protein
MNDERPESLDGATQRLARLPNTEVSAALEGRVLRSLVRAGVLRRAPHRVARRLVGLGAALLLFRAGVGIGAQIGRARDTAIATQEPQYLLLLYTGGSPHVEDVAAHRRWAHDLTTQGHTVYGERLSAIATASAADTLLAGFFIVSAPSANVAQTIAASSPHARHGGRVVIYRIRPT